MRLNVRALSLTLGILWGAAILIVSLANWVWPSYGYVFLEFTSSIYPGYLPDPTVESVLIGTLYGFVDGVIGGAIFAWLYNFFASRFADMSH